MKIVLKDPITHDEVNYGRGVHAFPDKLAQKFLTEASHAAILFVPEGSDAEQPGSVTLPGHLSKGAIQDKILARIGALNNRRNSLQGAGLPVDEIDNDIDVLQWQLRCVECGNASEETLADHLNELHRQKVRSRTPRAEVQPETLALSRSNPPATRPKKAALPPKRQDLSSYFDAANLTATQRDYLSLKFEHDMSVTEIARLRNKHHSSVQETLERAQAKLKSIPNQRLVSDRIRREGDDEILRRIDQERDQNEGPSFGRPSRNRS